MILHKSDLPLHDCEIKLQRNGRFEGYASVFGGVDSYNDTIEPGAFKGTLEGRQRAPLMLFGHNPGRVIGKWLHLEEDSKGLVAQGEFTPGHSDAQNVLASLRHGAIDGLSIGFRIPKGGADEKDGGGRLIRAVDLVEISVVTMPADDAARVHSVKEQMEQLTTLRDIEAFLRESGCSRAAAGALLSRAKAIWQREAAGCDGEISGVKEQVSTLLDAIRKVDALLT